MVINTWGMPEQGLHAVEEQDACAMPNTNWSGSELQNTRLDTIKNMGTLGKMVNHVILTERGYFRARTRTLWRSTKSVLKARYSFQVNTYLPE